MRTKLIVLSFLLITAIRAQNKAVDTIYCEVNNTSYLIFADKIDLVDIGATDDYAAKIEDNAVFVKALKENVPASTILVKMGKEFYFGMLKFSKTKKKFFYDFKNSGQPSSASSEAGFSNSNKANSVAPSSNEKVVSTDPNIKPKMDKLLAVRNEINTLGFISSTIDVAVTVIRNDNSNTYLKVIFSNKSSIPYKLDFISFQYFQDMKKGIGKKSKKAPMDVFPVGEPSIKEIAPVKKEVLCYVIPTFALANDGYLMMLVRESSGDRILKIKIDGETIQKSPQLN